MGPLFGHQIRLMTDVKHSLDLKTWVLRCQQFFPLKISVKAVKLFHLFLVRGVIFVLPSVVLCVAM